MIKLIALDLDDTLLNSKKEIDEDTIIYLKELMNNGIKVFFASARGYYALIDYANILNPTGFIYNGGSTIMINNKLIYENTISLDVSKKIYDDVKKIESLSNIMLEDKNGVYNMHPKNKNVKKIDKSFTVGYPFYKITLQIDDILEAEKLVNKYENDLSIIQYRLENNYRFASLDSNKGTALKYLMEYYGFKKDEVLAIGDDVNDLDMYLVATSVAMKNALENVKEKADYITEFDNDNKGVYHFLKKMLKK